jgi:hypothetical protein
MEKRNAISTTGEEKAFNNDVNEVVTMIIKLKAAHENAQRRTTFSCHGRAMNTQN